ncbi:MAG: ParA family protein [Rhodothermales bacterium]
MKVIACYNIKGGVGKTTTAVNLAYISAASGSKTLLWDIDLQGSASMLFQSATGKDKSIKVFGDKGKKAKSQIQKTAYKNLDILPADFSLFKLDRKIGELDKPRKTFKALLSSFSGKYDTVFIDCPAGYNLFTQTLQQTADVFLIPIIPSPLTLSSYDIFKKQLKKDSKKGVILFPFFSMVDKRKQLHKEIIELHKNGTKGFLHSHIPYSSKVERMAVELAPLHTFDKRSVAAKAYKSLWDEINTNIGTYERVKKIKMW